jgi:hypothetical protein
MQTTSFMFYAVAIGSGATLLMDLWQLVLKQFGVATLNVGLLGRWVGHIARGCWTHASIAKATPIGREAALGWFAHYAIGIAFAALLLLAAGTQWARSPSLVPALAVGVGTVVAPLLVMQPGMGAGIAFSRTPRPLFNSLKSLANHSVFGVGLHAAAVGIAYLVNAYSMR